MNFRVPSNQKHSMILWFSNPSDHNGTMISDRFLQRFSDHECVPIFTEIFHTIPPQTAFALAMASSHHSFQPLCDLIILSLFPLSFPIDELTSYSRKFY